MHSNILSNNPENHYWGFYHEASDIQNISFSTFSFKCQKQKKFDKTSLSKCFLNKNKQSIQWQIPNSVIDAQLSSKEIDIGYTSSKYWKGDLSYSSFDFKKSTIRSHCLWLWWQLCIFFVQTVRIEYIHAWAWDNRIKINIHKEKKIRIIGLILFVLEVCYWSV